MASAPDTRLSGLLEPVEECLFCNSPLCSNPCIAAEDYFFSAVEGSFRFVSCRDCGSLNLLDRLLPEHLLDAYRKYYTHACEDQPERYSSPAGGVVGIVRKVKRMLQLPTERLRHRRMIAEVPTSVGKDVHFRLIPPPVARILDYGCGGGAFMRHVASLGHEVVGIDFDPDVLKDRHKEGFEAYLPSAMPRNLIDTFDIVSLRHVIEHLPKPEETLRTILRCLKPGGRLFIETPHAQAEGLRVYGRYWRGLEAPRHLAIPSLGGLSQVLSRAGFTELQPYFRTDVRKGTWPLSDSVVPEAERPAMESRRSTAGEECLENSEYIDLWCRKP